MFSKLIVVAVFIGAICAQRQLPGRSSSAQADHQQSDYFRESVAQSIRDNIARQRSITNSQFVQTIDYPGTVVGNNEHPATFTVPPSVQPQSVIRPIPSGVTPILRIPLPVLLSEPPPPSQPERIIFPVVTEDDEVPRNEFEDEAEHQAKNAHYSFDSSVQDTINDHSHTRQEKRDGLSLKGMYSYSDGFFRRTVHYAADEGGYRVTKEEIVPIGDGPQFNPDGKADVSTSLTGRYTITTDDLKRAVPTKVQA